MAAKNSSADDVSKENLRLKSAVEELSILNDIATAITSTQSLEQINKMIVKKCISHLKAEQGSIQMLDEKDFNNPFHTMIRVKESRIDHDPLRFDKQLSDLMLSTRKALLINEFKTEETVVLGEDSVIKIRSLLSVPLVIKGKMIGILTLFNKKGDEGFTESDKRLLSIIAAQSASVIENSRLFEEEKKLIVLRQEMKLAGEIQRNILPKQVPQLNGYDIYAVNIPAGEVGGDYYDFIKISESKTAFALGDVCGKGLPASMLMANVQATLRSQLLFSDSARLCIHRANNLLYQSTERSKFVTLFFGILNIPMNTFTYTNAGHVQPVITRDGKTVILEKSNLILGCFENAVYDEKDVILGEGESLVIFSDGITEALDKEGEQFGEERLYRVIEEKHDLGAKALADEIVNCLKSYSGSTEQSDDITLMVIKRTSD